MMTSILKLCVGLAFVATVIFGEPDNEALLLKLNEMVADKELIDNEFRPIQNGYIGKGSFGAVFKGERVSDNKSVALKFTTWSHRNETDREYEMYTYLSGVDNEGIEEFGFCNIYYYGDFNLTSQTTYKLMIFTYLSGTLARPAEKGYFNSRLNERYGINSLILFRDFISQAKYMHRHGVRHDDIKPDNLLLRGHRSFLIDFNLSSRLDKKFGGGTLLYGSRNFHRKAMRSPVDDFESFLYSMAHINSIPLKWFFRTPFERLSPNSVLVKFRALKENTTDTFAKIVKTITKCEPLKTVFLEFAKEVFISKNSGLPNYRHLEIVVEEQIAKMVPENHPVVFTWLESDLSHEAINDLLKSPMRTAQNMNPINSFGYIKYPRVDYKYFQNKKQGPSVTLSQRIIATFMNLMTVCDKRNYKHHEHHEPHEPHETHEPHEPHEPHSPNDLES